MWFKNLHVYQLPKEFRLDADEFSEKLASRRFNPCGRLNDKSIGWVSPIHHNKEFLIHSAGGCHLFCMRKEQKVIPSSAIKEAVEEKIQQLEDELGRSIYRKEKQSIKEDIISTMLPKAFVRSSHIKAYFDLTHKLLVIDVSSAAQVDEFYQLLLDTFGSFGAFQLTGDENPAVIMSSWIKGVLPKEWALSGEYLLKDHKDDRVARFKDYDEQNPFVKELLDDGYSIKRMGVSFKNQLKAVIQDDLQIKSLKFRDELLKDNDELKDENELVKFDADFAIMTASLADFIGEIKRIFLVEQ